MPTTFNVSDEADLNADIKAIDGAASGAYQLHLTGNILEANVLEAINLHSRVTLRIYGAGFALDGVSGQRGLFVYSGNVAIEDLTIQNATADGGAGNSGRLGGGAGAKFSMSVGTIGGGSGGGLGAGGDIFVQQGGSLSIEAALSRRERSPVARVPAAVGPARPTAAAFSCRAVRR